MGTKPHLSVGGRSGWAGKHSLLEAEPAACLTPIPHLDGGGNQSSEQAEKPLCHMAWHPALCVCQHHAPTPCPPSSP